MKFLAMDRRIQKASLLLQLLLTGVSGTLFYRTSSNQAFTGSPLQSTAGVSVTQCAVRCAQRAVCAAIQPSEISCLLLSAAPTADQLTDAPGADIFAVQLPGDATTAAAAGTTPGATTAGTTPETTTAATGTTTEAATTTMETTISETVTTTTAAATTTTTASPCPSDWVVIGTACYFISTPGTSEALWQADSDFCAAQFGASATLPAFETEAQYAFLIDNVSGLVWTNIRYVTDQFQMFGGSSSDFWKTKWHSTEPATTDNGFVFFYGVYDTLWGAPVNAGPMPRTQVVCMIYTG